MEHKRRNRTGGAQKKKHIRRSLNDSRENCEVARRTLQARERSPAHQLTITHDRSRTGASKMPQQTSPSHLRPRQTTKVTSYCPHRTASPAEDGTRNTWDTQLQEYVHNTDYEVSNVRQQRMSKNNNKITVWVGLHLSEMTSLPMYRRCTVTESRSREATHRAHANVIIFRLGLMLSVGSNTPEYSDTGRAGSLGFDFSAGQSS
ncbi:hypothetical protein K458DRAFT_96604 [Lentithecium fluviatile CBS 122367]|uniref:Uncharacterized protein n=1 Tax=Lentithecium fluviatile CBS 122367 TaxID=1168545 RepID=A0A6G1JI71_9PLEO|nr:hypothetical protein K458DRAFT_96604 [Lentithecium fluviatile CBS 122367]